MLCQLEVRASIITLNPCSRTSSLHDVDSGGDTVREGERGEESEREGEGERGREEEREGRERGERGEREREIRELTLVSWQGSARDV